VEHQHNASLRIGVFGNSFWARRLADSLAGWPCEVECLYTDQDTTLKQRSTRQWLTESALWSFDVLHVRLHREMNAQLKHQLTYGSCSCIFRAGCLFYTWIEAFGYFP
jgi:hypothetical protein